MAFRHAYLPGSDNKQKSSSEGDWVFCPWNQQECVFLSLLIFIEQLSRFILKIVWFILTLQDQQH